MVLSWSDTAEITPSPQNLRVGNSIWSQRRRGKEGWVEVGVTGIQPAKLLRKRQREAARGEVKMCFGEKVQQKNLFWQSAG